MDKVPDNIRAGLQTLAAEWEDENTLLCQLLATVCRAAVVRHDSGPVVATLEPRRRRKPAEPNPFQVTLQLFEENAA
jgi:hypothetical protein